MQPLQWEHRPDGLRAPAVVCAFKGWNDAADAASSAATFVGGALGAQRFATIDPEEFYDYQATRPRIKLVEGQTRQIVWPAVELFAARVPRAPRDLIVVTGSEPSFRWRTFAKLIVELVEALGAQLVVTLGSLLADVPHTRPISVTGLASDPALIARLGLTSSSYEGPTGIVGVLHAGCQEAGLPSASLWAAVPHYIAATPNPKAALALVRKLEGLVGIAVDASELESAAGDYERQVNLAVQSDPDVQACVERRDDCARPPALPAPAGAGRPARARVALPLGRRAHQPVVADRARGDRRSRLKPLREDPVGNLHCHLPDPLAAVGRDRHLLIVEQVIVGLLGGVEAPSLARAHCVERELDVVGQLGRGLRPPGLVVDQLIGPTRQPVDPVDPAP